VRLQWIKVQAGKSISRPCFYPIIRRQSGARGLPDFIVAPEEAYEATKAPIVSYISIELREKQEGQKKIPET